MADIELLPLPPHFSHQHDNVKKIVREYAIANMTELVEDRDDLLARLDASIDHGTKLGAAQQRCLDEILEQKDEIERLQRELDRLRGEHVRVRRDRNAAEARAERLAEALKCLNSATRRYMEERPVSDAEWASDEPSVLSIVDAALDQEVWNG